jgi:hypothetical protein
MTSQAWQGKCTHTHKMKVYWKKMGVFYRGTVVLIKSTKKPVLSKWTDHWGFGSSAGTRFGELQHGFIDTIEEFKGHPTWAYITFSAHVLYLPSYRTSPFQHHVFWSARPLCRPYLTALQVLNSSVTYIQPSWVQSPLSSPSTGWW